MALLNDSLGGTKCWENGGRVADDMGEWLMMILQVSKTLAICICSISIIKCVAHFLLKGTEKLCALPQRNCHFLIPVVLQKFTAFIFRCLWRLFHTTQESASAELWTVGPAVSGPATDFGLTIGYPWLSDFSTISPWNSHFLGVFLGSQGALGIHIFIHQVHPGLDPWKTCFVWTNDHWKNRMSSLTVVRNIPTGHPFPEADPQAWFSYSSAAEQWSIHNLLKLFFLNLYRKCLCQSLWQSQSANLPFSLGPCFMDRNSDYQLINLITYHAMSIPQNWGTWQCPGNIRMGMCQEKPGWEGKSREDPRNRWRFGSFLWKSIDLRAQDAAQAKKTIFNHIYWLFYIYFFFFFI